MVIPPKVLGYIMLGQNDPGGLSPGQGLGFMGMEANLPSSRSG